MSVVDALPILGRVAELGGGEGVALGVRVVGEDAGGRAVEHCDRAALGHGGAVVVGDRRVVDGRDRNRDGGRAAALGVGHWRRARRAVVAGREGAGVDGGLVAVVAAGVGAVEVEGDASVGRVAGFGGGYGVPRGVRVFPTRRSSDLVEHCDRAALGHGGAVVVGDRRVVDGRDRNRDGGRAAALGVGHWRRARRAVVAGLVGEGVGRGLAAVVAVAEGAVGVDRKSVVEGNGVVGGG